MVTQLDLVLKSLTDFASGDMAEALRAVGIGIGAVMLMVVLFYYLVSILDGGRFQLRMAVPMLVFLFVCNFSWIARPVTSFTSALSGNLCESLDGTARSIRYRYGCDSLATLAAMGSSVDSSYVRDMALGQAAAAIREAATGTETVSADTVSGPVPLAPAQTLGERLVTRGISGASDRLADNINRETGNRDVPSHNRHAVLCVIGSVVAFVVKIFEYVMKIFGTVMMSIVIAFGPVTFAFAIMPGQARTIKTWFIRLCQFALYAPLASLVSCFSVMLFDMVASVSGAMPALMVIAVSVVNLVALTSIPSIASMVIEGAAGGVSLSQGLQTLSGAVTGGLTAGKTVVGGAATGLLGRDTVQKAGNAVSDAVSGAGQMGLAGMARSAFGKGGSVRGTVGEMMSKGAEGRQSAENLRRAAEAFGRNGRKK